MRRKEERSKQGQTNNKAKQHSTPKVVCTYSVVCSTQYTYSVVCSTQYTCMCVCVCVCVCVCAGSPGEAGGEERVEGAQTGGSHDSQDRDEETGGARDTYPMTTMTVYIIESQSISVNQ